MGISVKEELRTAVVELQRRFLTVSLDFGAPLRLFDRGQRQRWRQDWLGGFVVSIMGAPQVMAYAIIAGVPPTMGLYSLAIVSLIAGLWCFSPHLACGPSNASSLMLGAVLLALARGGDVLSQVALIALVMGLFQVVAAVLGVGGLTRYISRSVVVGYTTAIGVLIFLNQIPGFIGTKVDKDLSLFPKVWASVCTIPETHLPSALVAVVSLLCMMLVRRVAPRLPSGFFGILGGGLCAWGLAAVSPDLRVKLVEDVQRIPLGFPSLVLPSFEHKAFYDLAGPAIALGLLACIEVSTVSKNMAIRTGQKTQPNQDILGLGLGNTIGAFFGAMPGSVSFTRSEFSYRNHVVTRWGVVSSALFALGIVTASGPLLEKIPLPALAALIMWVSLKLIGLKSIRIALTATHSDALVYLTTFLAAIFLRLDYAIYLGVLVSMGLFLQKASVPRLMEFEFDEQGRFRRADKDKKSAMPQISIVHVEGELFFGAAETLEEEILRSIDRDSTKVIILRLRNAHNLDASGVMVLAQMIRDLRETGIHVLISGTNPEVDRVIQRAGFEQIIGKENYFPSQENFLEATRRAVFRAHEIVGVKSPVIRLFYDKDQEQARTQPATGSPP